MSDTLDWAAGIATGAQAGRKLVTLQTLFRDAVPLGGDAGKTGECLLRAGAPADECRAIFMSTRHNVSC